MRCRSVTALALSVGLLAQMAPATAVAVAVAQQGTSTPSTSTPSTSTPSTATPTTSTPTPTPPATSTPAPTVPAPTPPATAPNTPAPQPAPAPGAAPDAAGDQIARAAQQDGSKGTPPVIVALAVLVALLAVGLATWGVVRWAAWEPRWAPRWRHSAAEAGWRASLGWADFRDWLRLGR